MENILLSLPTKVLHFSIAIPFFDPKKVASFLFPIAINLPPKGSESAIVVHK
jgi:hypothetical protein